MTEIDGVGYYVVPTAMGCNAGDVNCHFRGVMTCRETGRDSLCDPFRGASENVIFLAHTEYVQYIAERLTK